MNWRNKGLLSIAAATILATASYAGSTDYNGSFAAPCQVGSCKDTNTTIVFNGEQNVLVENVFVTLNNDSATADKNLTAGNKLFIELPSGVTFAEAPEVRANQYIFVVNDSAAKTKTADITTNPDTGNQRALVTVDVNTTSGTEIVFRNVRLNIPSDYASNELNVTFGSIRASDLIPDTNDSVKPLVANVKASFPKNPIVCVNGVDATDDNTPPVIKRSDITDGNDAKKVSVLFKVDAGSVAGSVIDLKMPTWAQVVNNYPTIKVLTDKVDADAANTDINATAIGVKVEGVDNNNTIRITLNNETPVVTEIQVGIHSKDINITTEQPDGTVLPVTIDTNATLINAPANFDLFKLKSKGLVIEVNATQDRNITRGALYANKINDITIKTNFEHDWNDTNATVSIPSTAIFGDLNITEPATLAKYITIKDDAGKSVDVTTIPAINIANSTLQKVELNLSVFDGNKSITITPKVAVNSNFVGTNLPLTVALTNPNDTIELRAEVTAQNGANVQDPEVKLDTNETDKKVGVNFTGLLRVEANETRYGSLQLINNVPTRYFIESVNCAKINDSGTSTAWTKDLASSAFKMDSGVQIDDSKYRYTLQSESNETAVNAYTDINITVPDTCQPGDLVQVKLVREDGKDYGTVTLASVSNTAQTEVVEANVTVANEIAPQTLGTINVKSEFEGAMNNGGAFTIIAPVGMQNLKADVSNTNLVVETNATGLDGRAVIIKVNSATTVDTNITLTAEVGDLSGVQVVEIKDGNVSQNYDNKANIVEGPLKVTYVSADGTIPAPVLEAEGNTTVVAGTEANITLSCQGVGLGTYSYILDNANAPHITLNNNIVSVSADAEVGEEATAKCTESFGGKTSPNSNEVTIKVVDNAPLAVSETDVSVVEGSSVTLTVTGVSGTLEAASSDEGIATVEVNGTNVTVTGVAPGTATITLSDDVDTVTVNVEVTSAQVTGEITLVEGKWNLITTPVPAPMPSDKLADFTSRTVWAFDSVAYSYTPAGAELEVGKGYWVKADKKGGTITYSATPTVESKDAQWTLIKNNLVAGKWNLLGTSFDTTKTEIKEALGVNSVWPFDAEAYQYSTAEDITAGKGFWAK